MNFDFSDDQKMLKETAHGFLAEHAPLELCRTVLESDETFSAELWRKSAQLGWQGTAIPEAYGGAGFGHLELAVIAEEIGYALAPIPFSSSAYLAAEAVLTAGTEEQKKKYLPKLASGESIGVFAMSEKPGDNGVTAASTKFNGGNLSGEKFPVPDGEAADIAVVVVDAGNEIGLAIVDTTASGVTRARLSSFDPSRSMSKFVFDGAPAELLGDQAVGRKCVERLLDRAAVLTAFEQVGTASRAFEITKEYTLERYAFGRQIASFQAIKHKLADRWCDIEIARSNSYYGAWALEHDNDELGIAACLSRIAASEALDEMGVDMIQLHGGVGFTWEFDCHMFYRRSKWLSAFLGSTSSWKSKLVDRFDPKEEAA